MKSKVGEWPPSLPVHTPGRPRESYSLGEHAIPVDGVVLRAAYDAIRDEQDAALALNVHLPFCPSRCLSCDRVAVVEHRSEAVDRYIDNLDRELALTAANLGGRKRLARVHFGGGSPNYLSELALANICSHVHRHFDLDDNTRVTMELNPRRTSRAQLNFLKGLGINHVKLEVRDVDAAVQREIGRIHSLELLEDVISIARAAHIESVGMDYLIGLPGQTVESCEQSIEAIVSLAPDWLVCQPFHRRESAFPHQIAVEPSHLPSLADRLYMFNSVAEGFIAADYEWVGLNVFAGAASELARAQREGTLSLSVLGYNNDRDLTVLGVGLGALSEVSGIVMQNHTRLDSWHRAIESGVTSAAMAVPGDSNDMLRKKVLRHLMCQRSVPVATLSPAQAESWLTPLVEQGYAEEHHGHFRMTVVGRSVLPHLWSDSSPAFRAL